MYRILRAEGATQERRRGHRRHQYAKPELLALLLIKYGHGILQTERTVNGAITIYMCFRYFSRYVVAGCS